MSNDFLKRNAVRPGDKNLNGEATGQSKPAATSTPSSGGGFNPNNLLELFAGIINYAYETIYGFLTASGGASLTGGVTVDDLTVTEQIDSALTSGPVLEGGKIKYKDDGTGPPVSDVPPDGFFPASLLVTWDKTVPEDGDGISKNNVVLRASDGPVGGVNPVTANFRFLGGIIIFDASLWSNPSSDIPGYIRLRAGTGPTKKNFYFKDSGAIFENGLELLDGQLLIDIASGSPPMVIVSTDKVDNLNADLLDGQHAADIKNNPFDQSLNKADSPQFVSGKFTGMKSGATQAAAGAVANELWKTAGHLLLPDNVIMIGV